MIIMIQYQHETIEQGRKLALVMGGGGGKGGAHLGVLNTIEALGMPIDMMVGTSIGGVATNKRKRDMGAAGFQIPHRVKVLYYSKEQRS